MFDGSYIIFQLYTAFSYRDHLILHHQMRVPETLRRKLEYPEKIHAGKWRTWKLHTRRHHHKNHSMIPSVEFEQCKVHQKMENVSTNHQLALLGFKEMERKEKHIKWMITHFFTLLKSNHFTRNLFCWITVSYNIHYDRSSRIISNAFSSNWIYLNKSDETSH